MNTPEEAPPEEARPERPARRYPSTIGGVFYLLILLTALGAIGYVALTGEWRTGVRVLAGALGVAGALRLVLPEKDAGMLAVRNRYLDTFLLVGTAIILAVLTSSIPDQPPLG